MYKKKRKFLKNNHLFFVKNFRCKKKKFVFLLKYNDK